MPKVVCFTGHRTVPPQDYAALNEQLHACVEDCIAKGATTFRTGGALGFDTMAALCVLQARQNHPHVRLELILPYPEQADMWSASDTILYHQILEQADAHRFVSSKYYAGVLQLRNRALVEGADLCVAYLCSSHGGGAAYTASYALKKGLELINLQDLLS